MALFDEEQRKREKKKADRMNRILVSSIILTILIIIGLACIIYYLIANPNKITVNLDGKENVDLESLLETTTLEDGGIEIKAPIKDIASYFGYKAFNGGYTTVSESTDSCYIENDDEVSIFNLDSNIIYKLDLSNSNSEYEYCKITNSIFSQDGKLYTDEEGLEKGFNLSITYDQKKKTIDIYTLDKLVEYAESKAKTYKYESLDTTFVNYRAILDNMMVVISSDDLYGVISFGDGTEILGAQYDSITYIPQKSAFLVEKNDKFGIIGSDGDTKIETKYDELLLIDDESGLYLAKNNGLYGVLDINGKTIIYIEYDKIGVDISQYSQDELKTGYILLDKLIPVQQNGKWGFFDKEGNQVSELAYDSIGSITSNKKSVAYNVLIIPEKEAVVVKKDSKYSFMKLNGEEAQPFVFDDVYMEVSSGEEEYYMTYNEKEYKAVDYID